MPPKEQRLESVPRVPQMRKTEMRRKEEEEKKAKKNMHHRGTEITERGNTEGNGVDRRADAGGGREMKAGGQ